MSRIFQPMLANPVSIDDIPTKCAGYVMEPKLDGVRCIADTRNGKITLSTRTGKDLTEKLPHLASQLADLPDCVFDGEVGYFDEASYTFDFNRTMRVLGSGVDVALGKQYGCSDEIKFCIFDLLWCSSEGGDLRGRTDAERHSYLCWSLGLSYSSDTDEDIFFVDRTSGWEFEFYTSYVEAGGEGVILKNPNATYVEGKRPTRTWYKVKKFDTLDVVVCGYQDGQGKYEGQVGAVWFGLHNLESLGHRIDVIGKCSGMDDETRLHISQHRADYVGRVMEIRYFGKVGRDFRGLRHPQFIRFRDDKDPKECTL